MNSPGIHELSAVIFDLDGTLADTLNDITDSINLAFTEMELPAVGPERVRYLIGEGLLNLLRLASGVDDEAVLSQLVEQYRTYYTERMMRRTRLYGGVPELLDELCNLSVPLSVLSNKPDEFTVPICRALLGRWPFVEMAGAKEASLKKPDASVALTQARSMGRDPKETVFVGDSAVDIHTAHNAGMTSVAVTWGYRDRDELERANPSYIIEHPQELLKCLTR